MALAHVERPKLDWANSKSIKTILFGRNFAT
jgi:hypothetical protein